MCGGDPGFNEAAQIGEVVTAVRRYLPNVIVVDDGSTDATTEKAKAAGAEVICHPKKSGKGAALRSGWQARAPTWLYLGAHAGWRRPARRARHSEFF